jgi:membrane protein required for beta-lactamase induction
MVYGQWSTVNGLRFFMALWTYGLIFGPMAYMGYGLWPMALWREYFREYRPSKRLRKFFGFFGKSEKMAAAFSLGLKKT